MCARQLPVVCLAQFDAWTEHPCRQDSGPCGCESKRNRATHGVSGGPDLALDTGTQNRLATSAAWCPSTLVCASARAETCVASEDRAQCSPGRSEYLATRTSAAKPRALRQGRAPAQGGAVPRRCDPPEVSCVGLFAMVDHTSGFTFRAGQRAPWNAPDLGGDAIMRFNTVR